MMNRRMLLMIFAALFLSTPTFAVESRRPHVSLGGSFGILLAHQSHPGTIFYKETSPGMWNLDGELLFDTNKKWLAISVTFGYDFVERAFISQVESWPGHEFPDMQWTERIYRLGLRASYRPAVPTRLWLGAGIARSNEDRTNSPYWRGPSDKDKHSGVFAEAGVGFRPLDHVELYAQYQWLKLNNVSPPLSTDWRTAYAYEI
ncbi:MAG: outer membrane beta-barrel protein, partial [bacterium]